MIILSRESISVSYVLHVDISKEIPRGKCKNPSGFIKRGVNMKTVSECTGLEGDC